MFEFTMENAALTRPLDRYSKYKFLLGPLKCFPRFLLYLSQNIVCPPMFCLWFFLGQVSRQLISWFYGSDYFAIHGILSLEAILPSNICD